MRDGCIGMCVTLTSDSGIAAATLDQDFTEQVLAATASVVAMVMVAPFHDVEPWAEVGMARHPTSIPPTAPFEVHYPKCKSPKRCQLILLLSWMQTVLKPTFKRQRFHSESRSQGEIHTNRVFQQPKKYSSKQDTERPLYTLSLLLFFCLCFLFGAELSLLWTAWSNDRLGDCFGARERDSKGEIERESKGRVRRVESAALVAGYSRIRFPL